MGEFEIGTVRQEDPSEAFEEGTSTLLTSTVVKVWNKSRKLKNSPTCVFRSKMAPFHVLFVFSVLISVTLACDKVCPFHYRPVCGSDGITYSNLCFLRTSQCRGGVKVNFRQGTLQQRTQCSESKVSR